MSTFLNFFTITDCQDKFYINAKNFQKLHVYTIGTGSEMAQSVHLYPGMLPRYFFRYFIYLFYFKTHNFKLQAIYNFRCIKVYIKTIKNRARNIIIIIIIIIITSNNELL